MRIIQILQVSALLAWAGAGSARAQYVVVCMGDSITQGRPEYVSVPYPTRLQRNMGVTTVNVGVGGVPASYGLSIVDSLLAQLSPACVLILYGTNDINVPEKNLQSSASTILQIAQRVRASGAVPVIGTVPPMVGPRAYNMTRVNQLNNYLRSYAAANGIALADIQKAFGSGSGLMTSDGFHPNDAGMEVIAQTFGARLPPLRLSPPSAQIRHEGTAGQVFQVGTVLSWTATANAVWVAVTAGASGSGTGDVTYSVSGNIGPSRSGTITVAGGGQSAVFKVSQSASPSLTIASRHGEPDPAAGTAWMPAGTPMSAQVGGSPVEIGAATQFVCVGWAGSGSAPKSGATTNTGPFTVTNTSSVTWQWRTNYWLETAAGEGGAVDVASGWQARGTSVPVRAVPDLGWRFAKWSGASTSTSAAISVSMSSAKTLVAEFAVATNSLRVASVYGEPEPSGTNWMRKDTVTNASISGSPIEIGTSTQYVCTGWAGSGSVAKSGVALDTGPFTITNNTVVTWQWRTNYWLETAAGEGGAVDVASGWWARGASVPVRAVPDLGWRFAKWSGASTSTSAAISVSMSSAKTLVAEFAVATNSLRVASVYGEPEPSGTNWMRKDTVTNVSISGSPIEIGTSTQYVCTGWAGSGSVAKSGAGTNTGPFTITNNTVVTWQWRTNYWLATAAGEGGAVDVASGWQARGSSVPVRAVPDLGWRFARWSGASTSTSAAISVSMSSAKTLVAEFAVATNSLRVASVYGEPEPSGTNWMRKDTVTNASIAGSPIEIGIATQYVCTGWAGSGSVAKSGAGTNTGPFTITNNTVVTWQWRTNYWLATAADGSGTVSVASGWFPRGSNVAVQAAPLAGARFFRWAGASTSTAAKITVGMSSAKAVTALFGVEVDVQAWGLDGSVRKVAVRADPPDVFRKASGTTPCRLGHTNGTVVQLSAPATLSGGWKLVGWTGADSWDGTNAIWTAHGSNQVVALYDPPPRVAITNPTSSGGFRTTNSVLGLKGRASAAENLLRVEISNARSERDQICTGTTNWSHDGLTIYPGVNVITVKAVDEYLNTAVATLRVTNTALSSTLQGLTLLAGAVVRDIQAPDNLVPGDIETIQWQVESFEPVRSGLKIRLPEGPGAAHVTINGRLAGSAPGTWTLGNQTSQIQSFEADWLVPNRPGACRIRFVVARQDGYAYVNANIPDGMDAAPYGMDGKEIVRTIQAGGAVPEVQHEALARDAVVFETSAEAQRRAGAVIQSIAIPDQLVPGSVVTCRWNILSYPAVASRLRIELPVEGEVVRGGAAKATNASVWRLPAGGTIVEYDGSATNDAPEKPGSHYKMGLRQMQCTWTVPNDPGTCRIGFDVALASGSYWVAGLLREGVDGRMDGENGWILRDILASGVDPVPLAPGVTNTSGNLRYAGDANWFVFEVAEPGNYRAQTYLGTLTDTILKLYGPGNPNDLIQANDNAVGLASRIVLPLEAGTYYLKVTAPADKKGTYRILVAPSP
jgi:lysophospholipase L1-like esterase